LILAERRQLTDPIQSRLEQIFRAVFELPPDAQVLNIRQINFRKWDSLGHVLLMSAVESEFGLEINIAASTKLTSFESLELYLTENARDRSAVHG
jgi:acyl carrier protein